MKNATAIPQKKTEQTTEIQAYGTVVPRPIGLKDSVRLQSVNTLNQVLADTITLRDLYKKHHWQTAGSTFYQIHLLFDKHYAEQAELVDDLAERVQQLGGVSLAMGADISEVTQIQRPPRGREDLRTQLKRLLDAHQLLLEHVRAGAKKSADAGDDGTNDLLVSGALRTNEMQVWFLAEHLESLAPAGK